MEYKSNAPALVLLDRDGVLGQNLHEGVRRYSDFRMVPHLSASFRKLNREGFRIGIITNQPYIGEGTATISDQNRIGRKIIGEAKKAGIKASHFTIKICPHAHGATCSCRKPRPGLIKQSVKTLGINPAKSRFYIVGDNLKDLQTLENYYSEVLKPKGVGRSSITTIFLVWKYGEDRDSKRLNTAGGVKIKPDFRVNSLDAAFKIIIKTEIQAVKRQKSL